MEETSVPKKLRNTENDWIKWLLKLTNQKAPLCLTWKAWNPNDLTRLPKWLLSLKTGKQEDSVEL